jgi:hypothetical protein
MHGNWDNRCNLQLTLIVSVMVGSGSKAAMG